MMLRWLIATFFLGCIVFVTFDTRFGPRIVSVGQNGAQMALDDAFSQCPDTKGRTNVMRCLGVQFERIVPRWGVARLLGALKSRQQAKHQNDFSVTVCHDITHKLGEVAVDTEGDIARTFTECSDLCQSGCFHGAVDAWLKKGNSIDTLGQLCTAGDVTDATRQSCVHGVGHAIVDILGQSLDDSLRYCNGLIDEDRSICGGGVFMELYREPTAIDNTYRDMPDKPLQWCAGFDNPYDAVCYEQLGVYEYVRSQDVERAVAYCHEIPFGLRRTCIIQVGKSLYFSLYPTQEQINKADLFCQQYLSNEPRSICSYEIFYNSPT